MVDMSADDDEQVGRHERLPEEYQAGAVDLERDYRTTTPCRHVCPVTVVVPSGGSRGSMSVLWARSSVLAMLLNVVQALVRNSA